MAHGKVRVGIPGMLGSCYFPPILMAFCRRYPGIRLSIVDGGADQLQKMLIDGELDLAFVVAENIPETLQAETFLRTDIVAAVPVQHPFASLKVVPVGDFLQQELVMFKEGYFHRRIIDQVAEAIGIQLNISIETNLIGLMKSLVLQGFGITAFLEKVLDDEPGLVAVPFVEPLRLDIRLAWRRDGYLSVANRAFRDYILEETVDN